MTATGAYALRACGLVWCAYPDSNRGPWGTNLMLYPAELQAHSHIAQVGIQVKLGRFCP